MIMVKTVTLHTFKQYILTIEKKTIHVSTYMYVYVPTLQSF